jgi:hypothetical protein
MAECFRYDDTTVSPLVRRWYRSLSQRWHDTKWAWNQSFPLHTEFHPRMWLWSSSHQQAARSIRCAPVLPVSPIGWQSDFLPACSLRAVRLPPCGLAVKTALKWNSAPRRVGKAKGLRSGLPEDRQAVWSEQIKICDRGNLIPRKRA